MLVYQPRKYPPWAASVTRLGVETADKSTADLIHKQIDFKSPADLERVECQELQRTSRSRTFNEANSRDDEMTRTTDFPALLGGFDVLLG